ALAGNRTSTVTFDARPYFRAASVEELVQLARDGWGPGPAATRVAYECADESPALHSLLARLHRTRGQANRDEGLACRVDALRASDWLQVNRWADWHRVQRHLRVAQPRSRGAERGRADQHHEEAATRRAPKTPG